MGFQFGITVLLLASIIHAHAYVYEYPSDPPEKVESFLVSSTSGIGEVTKHRLLNENHLCSGNWGQYAVWHRSQRLKKGVLLWNTININNTFHTSHPLQWGQAALDHMEKMDSSKDGSISSGEVLEYIMKVSSQYLYRYTSIGSIVTINQSDSQSPAHRLTTTRQGKHLKPMKRRCSAQVSTWMLNIRVSKQGGKH